jgi:hypothetical protein
VSEPEREDPPPPDLVDEERVRRVARWSAWAQAGGLVFLAVVAMGLLPQALSAAFPGVGDIAAVPLMMVAIAVPIFLLMVAAFKIPR